MKRKSNTLTAQVCRYTADNFGDEHFEAREFDVVTRLKYTALFGAKVYGPDALPGENQQKHAGFRFFCVAPKGWDVTLF